MLSKVSRDEISGTNLDAEMDDNSSNITKEESEEDSYNDTFNDDLQRGKFFNEWVT
jgi:hypothetical protein